MNTPRPGSDARELERLKELHALHEVATILADEVKTVSETLMAVAETLPAALRFSGAAARISYGSESFSSPSFAKTPWSIEGGFTTPKGSKGQLELAYTQEPPDKEAFLPEETTLLHSVCNLLKSYLQHHEAEAEKTQLAERVKLLLESSGEGIYSIDTRGCCTLINRAGARLLGYHQEELLGKNMHALVHHSHADGSSYPESDCRIFLAFQQGKGVSVESEVFWRKNGASFPVEYSSHPLFEEGRVTGAVVTFSDISERKRAEEALEARNRQQAAVAALSQSALGDMDLGELFDLAVVLVAQTLELKLCKVLELLPGGEALVLRAGVGWQEGLVGAATVGTERESQAGYTLLCHEPVVSKDLKTETRFSGPNLLHQHRVVSGMSVIIRGRDGPYGVLGAHSLNRRDFSQDDVNFLQSVANVLAAAIGRKHQEQALVESEARLNEIIETVPSGITIVDPEGRVYFSNQAAQQMFGLEGERISDRSFNDVSWKISRIDGSPFPEDELPFNRVMRTGKAVYGVEHAVERADGSVLFLSINSAPLRDNQGKLSGMISALSDVTERIQTREQLAREKGFSDSLIDSLPGIFYLIDASGRFVRWNRRLEQVSGYSGAEVAELRPEDFVRSNDKDAIASSITEAFERGSVSVEGDLLGKDGRTIPYFVTGRRLTLEGKTYLLGTGIDMSERVAVERALRENEARLKLALNAARMGTWDWDIASGQVIWSESLEALYGLPAGGFNGDYETYMSFIHPDDRESIVRTIEEALKGKDDYAIEHRVRRLDGEERWIAGRGDVMRDERGAPVRMTGIALDITSRKRAEEEKARLLEREQMARRAAEEAKERLGLLAEAGVLLGSSLDYETTLSNVAFLLVPDLADWCAIDLLEDGELRRVALAHVDPAKVAFGHELHGRYPPDLNAEHGVARVLRTGEPELYPEISDALLEASARDPEHLKIVREIGMSSAIIVPLIVRDAVIGALTMVLAESGEHYAESDLSLAEDLARRAATAVDNARLLKEFKELTEALEARVEARTEALELANKELESFAYAVSHDLRTPLSGIAGFSQALLEDYGGTLDATGKRYLDRIQSNTQRMGDLIDDILKLSRVSRKEFQLRELSLCDLASDIVEDLRRRYPHQPSFSCEGGAPIQGDANLLHIALANLLDNAWKFTSRSERAEVRLGMLVGEEPVYYVRDNGAGFDMAYAEQLFQPFHRLHSSQEFSGTGIGLVTVKRIIQRHGGRIWVESVPEQGTTFYFTLSPDSLDEDMLG